jgi:hypothetical protein
MSQPLPALVVPTPEHVNRTLGDIVQLTERLQRIKADLAICFPTPQPHVTATMADIESQIEDVKQTAANLKHIFPEARPLIGDYSLRPRRIRNRQTTA